MLILTYTRAPGIFKPTMLYDEIAIITGIASMSVSQDKTEVYITVPDDFDKAALGALVAAHDPAQLNAEGRRAQRRETSRVVLFAQNIKELRSQNAEASTVAKLRAVNEEHLKISAHILRLLVSNDADINGAL